MSGRVLTYSRLTGMVYRMVMMVMVVMVGTVMAGSRRKERCPETSFRSDAPVSTDGTVWLYVFRLQACMWHSGIGTRAGYWAYAANGQYAIRDYSGDRCNGPLTYWYKLGHTNKTKSEINNIVSDLVRKCYPGYKQCWKFMMSHYSMGYWNCNYFTHHLAEALGVVSAYPSWLWNTLWPGFSC
ncbi:hypothetical protein OTU49_008484 [Cherax quadricarinatus]|uniref:PPPDE domain-containing protein n=1 Tax=Cherax quadricarinatus TaxID=27406 RepID=A0AAW0WNW1_CHEQU